MINTKLLLEDISDSVDKMYKQISDIEDLNLNNRTDLNDDFQLNQAYEYLKIYLHDIHIKVMYFLESLGLKELLNNYKNEVEQYSFTNFKY